jgi:transposase
MIKYKDIMKSFPDSTSRANFRYQLVVYAKEHGLSAAAREFNTTRPTVQKWVRRYDSQEGVESLKNQSRVGQNHPDKISEEARQRIIAFRKDTRNQLGARRIIEILGLDYSAKTVNKILKQNGLIKKAPTKWKKRWDMSIIRAQYKPFQKIQIDVKYLNDMPNCYEAYCKGDIPKFMISARDYKTGWLFMGFTNYLDSISTGIYAQYLIQGLKNAGVDMSEVTFQTDNGKEFVDRLTSQPTLFEKVLKDQVKHRAIPPASPRYNSDIEAFNGRVESEFFNLEDFNSYPDFASKALLYNVYFNMLRKNRNRNNKTPADILTMENKKVKPLNMMLPPIACDLLRNDYINCMDPVKFKGLPHITHKKQCARHGARRNKCLKEQLWWPWLYFLPWHWLGGRRLTFTSLEIILLHRTGILLLMDQALMHQTLVAQKIHLKFRQEKQQLAKEAGLLQTG